MTAARDDDFMALPGMEADSTDTHHGRERLSEDSAPTSPNASSKSALDALLDEYRARAKSEHEKARYSAAASSWTRRAHRWVTAS